jgi:hypothetical protein
LPFNDSIDLAIEWVGKNSGQTESLITECDQKLIESKRVFVLLFDALDRLNEDWGRIRELLSAALKLCLECRSRRAIRLKFFLRPDMIDEDDELWSFSDSSKLLHSKVELAWRSQDLFGLILSHLANSEVGAEFRKEINIHTGIQWRQVKDIFPLPRSLATSEETLRGIIEGIAGPWMGTSKKRGFTFTWIPTHLADAKGRASPRSFLLAFKRAAEWTDENKPGCETALHYEGIHDGVIHASTIRIREIKEDYPWVGPLLESARGLTVPCTPSELTECWTKQIIQRAIDYSQEQKRLPPRRFSLDASRQGKPDALVDDLVELAVLYRTEDRRLNMPDIFRVGFGIKRKGGVRPPR